MCTMIVSVYSDASSDAGESIHAIHGRRDMVIMVDGKEESAGSQYLVQWPGESHAHCSWEPERALVQQVKQVSTHSGCFACDRAC